MKGDLIANLMNIYLYFNQIFQVTLPLVKNSGIQHLSSCFFFGVSAQVLKSTMEKSYNVSINKATWKVIVIIQEHEYLILNHDHH
jgi:hypothetical protein